MSSKTALRSLRALPGAAALAAGLSMTAASPGFAGDLKSLSTQWEQLVLATPPAYSQVNDTTGDNCAVGQHGAVWFLFGVQNGTVTRSCSIPANVPLYFPVINSSYFDTPGYCPAGSTPLPVKDARAMVSSQIDTATGLEVTLDGQSMRHLIRRVRTDAFAYATPKDNLLTNLCGEVMPAKEWSYGIADGYYVWLPGILKNGTHTLHWTGTIPGAFGVDVTYKLNVTPLVAK